MNYNDDELKRKLAKASYNAPENPYFKRKVMNRLPEKRRWNYSWIVVIAYVVGAIVFACYWTAYLKQGVNISDPKFYILWAATLGFTISAVWAPLRRMLR